MLQGADMALEAKEKKGNPLTLVTTTRHPVTQLVGGDLPKDARHAGMPLSITIASRLTSRVIEEALLDVDRALRFAANGTKLGADLDERRHPLQYRPDVIVIDNSAAEKKAISAAYNRST